MPGSALPAVTHSVCSICQHCVAMKSTMKGVQFLFISVILGVAHVCADYAIIGESFTFTVKNPTCPDAVKCLLKTRDNSVTVAERVNGFWEASTAYKDRVQHESRAAVKLNAFNINDKGLFEFNGCCAEALQMIHVDALNLVHVYAAEGRPVALQSHFYTLKKKDVQLTGWERNGQLVCEATIISGNIGTETENGTKPCVPHDRSETGNFSLILQHAHMEQQGLYINYMKDEDGAKTFVAAVKLTVWPVSPVTTPHGTENTDIRIGFGVVLVLLVLVISGWISSVVWFKFCRSSGPAPGAAGRTPNGDVQHGLLPNGNAAAV